MPTTLLPAGVVILDRNTITTPDYTNLGPRFGFSWQITPNTVLNGGAGVTYDNWSGAEQAAQNARGAWPSGASQNVNYLNEAGVTPGATAQNPFVGTTTSLGTTPFPSGGGFLDTAWKDAYSWQWNLLLQRQFGIYGTVKAAYVGSSTTRAPIQTPANVNQTLGDYATAPFQNMSQFSEIESIGHASYDAFQGQYQKSSSKGLTVNTAFTWSKNINTGCSDYWEGCNIEDPYDLRSNRGVDSTDATLVLTASAVYELPFGKGKAYVNQGAAAQVLGGWKVNGMFAHRSGQPFTVGVNNDQSHSNGASARPNITGSTSGPKTRAEWFNIDAFSEPAIDTYGNAGRNSLRGPGYTNFDFSLFREFAIRERYKFEFRAESFNLFNHVNLGNPDSTFQDSNGNFGRISGANGNPRRFQFAGTFKF
jgi:hypothetical protein